MKKLILSALLALSVLASFAQTNTTVLRSRVTDSTTVTTVPTDWGAIYYNAQDNKWRVYEDGSWRDLGSGSGGGTITDGEGTTANGTAVDLGGAVTGNRVFTGTGNFVWGSTGTPYQGFINMIGDFTSGGFSSQVRTSGTQYSLISQFSDQLSFSVRDATSGFQRTSITFLGSGSGSLALRANNELSFSTYSQNQKILLDEDDGIIVTDAADSKGIKGAAQYAHNLETADSMYYVQKAYVDSVVSFSGTVRKDKVVSTTTYEVTDADNGYNIHFTNASGTAVTIPAGLMDSIYFTGWRNPGAGVVTFDDDGSSVLEYVGKDDGVTATLDYENAVASWFKMNGDTIQGVGLIGPTGGGSGAWGGITGDIDDQQDLLNYVAESIDSVGGITDGDKGDITVSSTGTVWTIDNLAVTAAKLATLSSSDLAGKLTDETGSGLAVFATSPTLTTPNLGTPGTLVLTNATGLPGTGLVNNAVTYAKIQQVSDQRILGNMAGGAGNVQELTASDIRALVFSSTNDAFLNTGHTGGGISGGFAIEQSGASAAISFTAVADPGGHPGIARITTGTTSSGFAYVITAVNSLLLGYGEVNQNTRMRITQLSSGTERFIYVYGLSDGTGGLGQDGVYVTYSDDAASGVFQFTTANNNTRTTTATDITVVAGTWYDIAIDINAAGTEARLYIDDVLKATHTTNIPTASGRQTQYRHGLVKTIGTTAVTMDTDLESQLIKIQ